MDSLRKTIRSLAGQSYKSYKMLEGVHVFPDFRLSVDHVQGDPFALPSRVSIHLNHDVVGLPRHLWSNPDRRRACEDFLARAVHRLISEFVNGNCGSGRSGEVAIACNGQQVLQRNCVLLTGNSLEARITVGLPADGRSILAGEAERILCDEIPKLVEGALLYENLSASDIEDHVYAIEDQVALRHALDTYDLVSFVADGSRLPRRSGIDDLPLQDNVVPIDAPSSLAVEIELPNQGVVRGLGIRKGVTLIVGGGFHGKSTLLHALQRGVYDHIPGDGRENTVCESSAMKVRAEDGRNVSCLDISAFINNLPMGQDTQSFSSSNASGSTSQAANIIEALQAGSRVLLMDEDTSATNFMIRDQRMQQLVTDDKEPITPFLCRVRELYDDHGISSVIVIGGSGDYLSVADTVIMMDNYRALDVTERAAELAGDRPATGNGGPIAFRSTRRPQSGSISALRGSQLKIDSHDMRELVFGESRVDVGGLEQLVDDGQVLCIGWMLSYYAEKLLPGHDDLASGMDELMHLLLRGGLDTFTPYAHMGNFAVPRRQELIAVLNRMREVQWVC